jgi:hypothetical protein
MMFFFDFSLHAREDKTLAPPDLIFGVRCYLLKFKNPLKECERGASKLYVKSESESPQCGTTPSLLTPFCTFKRLSMGH